jgi:RimJ/RimL family protein N-acetyltransferase
MPAIIAATDKSEKTAIHTSQTNSRIDPLKTKRLLLREFDVADVSAFHALESQEEVVRYQDYSARTNSEVLELVGTAIQESFKIPRQVYELAVEHNGEFIGRVGASLDHREPEKCLAAVKEDKESEKAEVPDVTNVHLWFSFLPSSQGKGFATEAMQAFMPLLGTSIRLEIECDPRNSGSWKLAERLGFERISLTEKVYETKGEWVDSLVYRKSL